MSSPESRPSQIKIASNVSVAGPRNNQQRKRPVTQGGVRAMVAKKDLETVNEVSASSKRNNNAVARRASTNSNVKNPKRRPSTQGGVANNVNVAKFLKWNPSGDSKDPRRHMGSSEAHARRQRIARLRQKHPAMVDQLMKDLKKEIGGRQGQTVEQMRRMMGAAATRSFLHRALFKRVAKAFYHWLCGGVDASLMGRLKTALNEEKEFTKQLEDHIKYQDDEAEKQRVQEEKMKADPSMVFPGSAN